MDRWAGIHTAVLAGCLIALMAGAASAKGLPGSSHGHEHNANTPLQPPADIKLLNAQLLDQNGRSVLFQSEVIGDNIVVMNFIYTTCTTQCPLNSQVLAQVQKGLADHERELVQLVSLSIDPGTDTPQRLKDYSSKIGAGPGWTWLTGHKPDVNRVLTGLGVYTPEFKTHPSVVLVGDGKSGNWTRFYGLAAADQLLAEVHDLIEKREQVKNSATPSNVRKQADPDQKAKAQDAKARGYFTDLPVVTHNGKTLRFYSDLLKDKVVLVSLFYSHCTQSCPLVNTKLATLQKMLGDHMGKNVFFISVTLDPGPDTPAVLKKYAADFQPQDGWKFVTGKPEDIKTITRRLGQTGDDFKAHSPFLLVGDVKRARWKKILPNVPNKDLADFLRQAVSDS